MADYHTLLKRAIAAVDATSPEARQAVYEKARTALVSQLKSLNPPLTAPEITRQRLLLEEAVRKVEAETVSTLRASARAAEGRPASAPASAPAFRVEPPAAPAAATTPSPAGPKPSAPQPPRPAAAEPESESEQAFDRAVEAVRGVAARQDEVEAPSGEDAHPPAGGRAEGRPLRPNAPPAAAFERPQAPPRAHSRAPAEPQRRRFPIGLVLAALLLVILAALGWWQRGTVGSLVAGLLGETTETREVPEQAADAGDTGAAGGVTSGPAAGGEAMAKIDDRIPREGIDEDGGDMPGAADTGSGTAAATAAQPAAGSESATAAAPAQMVAAPQRAILYEESEDPNGQGSAFEGNVIWQVVPDEASDAPSIRARIEVPDRQLTLIFTIKKNSDQTLPASHLVELLFEIPDDFPGQGIAGVPGLILKPSEQARGEPLRGATVRVAEGYFWVALSATPEDASRNLTLLRQQPWFDIPILYGNGKRAILTMEKGSPGTDAFAKVFAEGSTPG